jgi:hypothetical protein
VAREVLRSILRAHDFGHLLPWLGTIVALPIALEFARAIENEQSRLLGELVGRRALDRVLDVTTTADLLDFEDPEFHDRVCRAQMQGQFRLLQAVNGRLLARTRLLRAMRAGSTFILLRGLAVVVKAV